MIYSNCITHDYERKLGGNEKQMNITYNFQNVAVAIFKQGWEITWISLSAVIVALHCGKNKIIKDKQILGYMLWLAHGKCAYITNTNAFVYSIYCTNVCALCSCCTARLHCALSAVYRHPCDVLLGGRCTIGAARPCCVFLYFNKHLVHILTQTWNQLGQLSAD